MTSEATIKAIIDAIKLREDKIQGFWLRTATIVVEAANKDSENKIVIIIALSTAGLTLRKSVLKLG